MVKVMEITAKDMSKKNEKGFTFKLNLGERIYNFKADMEIQRKLFKIFIIITYITILKKLDKCFKMFRKNSK